MKRFFCYRLWVSVPLLMWMPVAFATGYMPPDTRSWNEVTQTFTAGEIRGPNDGERDGQRLKNLDPKRAAEFLLRFLSNDHPTTIRLKAIGALAAFPEAIPALSAIARAPREKEQVRSAALNPGLRYMQHPDALRTAIALSTDESLAVRIAAYRVIGEHGSEEAIAVLEKRLRAKDQPAMGHLIETLLTSKRPSTEVARIVFENCALSDLPADGFQAYATLMERSRFAPALDRMHILLGHADRSIQSTALRYFESFPRENVSPYLTKHIETDPFGRNSVLFGTVSAFIHSPQISASSKEKLNALIAAGKVMTPQ